MEQPQHRRSYLKAGHQQANTLLCCHISNMKFLKCLLIFLNLIFMVSGVILIVTGTVIDHLNSEYFHFLGNSLTKGSIILICTGAIIFFVTFCGCCGIINESYCLIVIYSACLSLLIIVEMYAGFAAYMYKSKVRDVISTKMKKGMLDYNMTDYMGMTHAWDAVQTHLHCCGTDNFMDWSGTDVWTRFGNNGSVPDTCCQEVRPDCGYEAYPNREYLIYTNGCLGTFLHMVKENISTVGGVGVGIGFIQMIGAIFSCCLASYIRKEEKEGYQKLSQKEH